MVGIKNATEGNGKVCRSKNRIDLRDDRWEMERKGVRQRTCIDDLEPVSNGIDTNCCVDKIKE